MSDEQELENGGYHPLFLPRDGESPEDFRPQPIRMIKVFRSSHLGERGELLMKVAGEELRDEEQIRRSFGGGYYELEARSRDGAVYRKEKIKLPPLDGEPAARPQVPTMTPLVGVAPTGGGGDVQGMFALMLQMMDRNANAQMQASREMLQMMLAMMSNNQQVLVAAMGQGAQGAAGMNNMLANVVTKAMDRPPPPQLDVKAIADLLSVAKKLQPGGDENSWQQLVSQFLGGVVGAQQMAQAGMNPMAVPPGHVPGQPIPQQPVQIIDAPQPPPNGQTHG
jgi:hypothetical protein